MKKVIDFITARPARFFLVAAFFWGVLMCFLNSKDGANFQWHDILVEANGMLFDLLVFGILLSVYEALREKREKIERLHEEIDDYREWDEKEAMYRIVGAVKRLNKLGVTNIDLSDCFLQNANLQAVRLQGSNLRNTNLQGAKLQESNLSNTLLSGANFNNTILFGADFKNAFIDDANFQNATLLGLNSNSKMFKNLFKEEYSFEMHKGASNAKSTPYILQLTNLEGACVPKKWFELLEEWNVRGREVIMKKYSGSDFGESFDILKEKPNLPPLLELMKPE